MSANEESGSTAKARLIDFRTEGFILAGLTVLTYLAAYRYEFGFCEYWDIPQSLIEISVVTVIAAGFAVIVFAWMLAIYVNPAVMAVSGVLREEDSFRRRFVITQLGFAALFVAVLYAFGMDWVVIGIVLSFIAFLEFLIFFAPWLWMRFVKKQGSGFLDRIQQYWQDDVKTSDLHDFASRRTGHNWALILMLFAGFHLMAAATGYQNARVTRHFHVDDSSNLVLLKRYGDTFVFHGVNPETMKFCGGTVLLSQSDVSGMKFMERDYTQTIRENREIECPIPEDEKKAGGPGIIIL